MSRPKGFTHTPETRAKLSAAFKGRPATPASTARLVAARKGRPSWNSGKTGVFSHETLAKMSAANTGRPSWNKGKTLTPETRTKISVARKGQTHSAESRVKMSAQRTRHGHASRGAGATPTYHSWRGMLNRCANPRAAGFAYYGGRGITVCERWQTFDNFLADMGERPTGKTIDRLDSNGHYEPGNCRWATWSEQRRNQRPRRGKAVAA